MARLSRSQRHVSFGSRTDIGCVRDHNEDSLVVAPPLYVVADGMGGHAAGEVASEIAVEVLAERAPKTLDPEALARAVEEANLAIINAARIGEGRKGMGTTCTAAMLEDERLIIAQVGDSRAYLMHNGKLQQLTRDHSLVADLVEAGEITPAQARIHPQRSAITRALGSDPRTQPDMYEINVEAGDRLLLCSDGLSSMLEDDEIQTIMNRTDDPQLCAAQLVNGAIAAGGSDNVTVIVVNITGLAEVRTRRIARKTKFMAGFIIVLLIAIIAGTVFGFNYWVSNSAFLAESDGKVAVYRGIPGEILGMSFFELDHVTDVDVNALQPGLANRLRNEGVSADNIEAANNLVEAYREEIEEHNQGAPGSSTASGSATKNSSASSSDAAKTNNSAGAPANNSVGTSTNNSASASANNSAADETNSNEDRKPGTGADR